MQIGDVITNATWITGDEPAGMKEQYIKDILGTFDHKCKTEGFIYAGVTLFEKHPEDHDVPPVPDHIQGSNVRLLVIEATIVDKLIIETKGSFINELERKDLMRLRKITRDRGVKDLGRIISNAECDEVIEELGPDAALATLRKVH